MSIDMYLGQARSQASSVKNVCNELSKGYNSLLKSNQQFIGAVELSSKGYGSAKELFSAVIQPLVQGADVGAEMTAAACQKFVDQYDSEVDSVDLKSDELQSKIQQLNTAIRNIETIDRNLPSLPIGTDSLKQINRRIINSLETTKRDIEKKLEDLMAFNSSSPAIFSEVNAFYSSLSQGLVQVNNSFNPSTGTFTIPKGKALDWTKTVKELYRQKKSKAEKISGVYPDEGIYGGNQSSPIEAYRNGDEKIATILKKYYPNMSDKEIRNYLLKLENEGCGYVALVNTFLDQYEGSEKEFEKKFGFPLYSEVNGKKVINYDYLIVDLYASQDNHNLEGFWPWDKKDVNNKKEDPSSVEGYGTTAEMREYRFENYMKDHNISVDVFNNEGLFGWSPINADIENYDQYKDKGNLIISVSPIKMTDVYGEEYVSDGGHAMTVTGKTKDGLLIVSSWGNKYYINPDDYKGSGNHATLQVINYEK